MRENSLSLYFLFSSSEGPQVAARLVVLCFGRRADVVRGELLILFRLPSALLRETETERKCLSMRLRVGNKSPLAGHDILHPISGAGGKMCFWSIVVARNKTRPLSSFVSLLKKFSSKCVPLALRRAADMMPI